MRPEESEFPIGKRNHPHFDTTHWSVVLAAGQRSSPDADNALQTLAQAYWQPLYAYARRRGYSVEDAADLTQAFFAALLETNIVSGARQDRGRFRSFLLASFKHFLANEWRRQSAQKRGGGRVPVHIDPDSVESRYCLHQGGSDTPDRLFERHWAITVLEQVLARLRDEFAQRGQVDHFELLKPLLAGTHETGAARDAAAALGMTPNSVQVAVHRMRRRYRELLRLTVAQTVAEASEVEDEILSLFRAVES